MQNDELSQFLRERQQRQDEYWTGPRFLGLLVAFLCVAISAIYITASIKSGDFSWNGGRPMANDVRRELPPSSW